MKEPHPIFDVWIQGVERQVKKLMKRYERVAGDLKMLRIYAGEDEEILKQVRSAEKAFAEDRFLDLYEYLLEMREGIKKDNND